MRQDLKVQIFATFKYTFRVIADVLNQPSNSISQMDNLLVLTRCEAATLGIIFYCMIRSVAVTEVKLRKPYRAAFKLKVMKYAKENCAGLIQQNSCRNRITKTLSQHVTNKKK